MKPEKTHLWLGVPPAKDDQYPKTINIINGGSRISYVDLTLPKNVDLKFAYYTIYLLAHGYVCWMVLEVVFAVVTSAVLDGAIRKEYPWLCPTVTQGQTLRRQYPEIVTKTKQLFFHKISGFVLSQTTPLVIYGYASLTLVAIYGNYMLIVASVVALMNALLNGIGASIGNLIAEGDKKKIKSSYWQITVLRMWMASTVCFGMYMLGDSFITLWMGGEYLLSHTAFVLQIIITFISLTRTNDTFIAAYGLFKDVWAPVVEALLNLGLSIVLGYFFGLEGILCGVLISLLVIVCGWKPYFLYRDGFNEGVGEYARWAVYALAVVAVYAFFSLAILYAADTSTRNLVKRIYPMIWKKKKERPTPR